MYFDQFCPEKTQDNPYFTYDVLVRLLVEDEVHARREEGVRDLHAHVGRESVLPVLLRVVDDAFDHLRG